MAIDKENNVNLNPLISAGWFNKICFWWLKDIIYYGKTKHLVVEDLYETIPEDLSEPLRNCLEIAWKYEIRDAREKKRKPNLWKAIAKTYCWNFLILSTLPISFIILLMAGPWFLELMMSYFRPTSTLSPTWAYVDATVFVILMILRTVFFHHSIFHLTRLGMRARIACTSLIYKKMVTLSASARRNSGNFAISLLTVDVSKFEPFFMFSLYVLVVPIQLLVTTYLIWQYIELDATLTSIALMILLTLPVLGLFYQKIFFKLRKKQTVKTDERLSLIGELITGIQAVKMYVWEKYFEECIRIARRNEAKSYLNISYIASVVSAISNFCHRLCVFVVVLIHVPQFGTISADKILPVAQYFNDLRLSITMLAFSGVRRIADMRVSIKRIEDFLLLPEVESNIEKIADGNTIILIKNATASWDKQLSIFENINLHFVPKSMYAIVGSVGSGKSSLLKLILGELPLMSGNVFVNGKVSYASQEPWLFPGSIKDNILFGEVYDKEKYNAIVDVCALLEDFSYLPYADETLVGDRGINLSGGQCARVNLARAVYREADVYLFDNPLSAVDTRVAKKLMNECINGLLKNKIRDLVTHSIGLLQDVDRIIFLNLGMVEFEGTVQNFRKNDYYHKYLPSDQTETLEDGIPKSISHINECSVFINSSGTKNTPTETEELIAKGAVQMSVYLRYLKAVGFRRVLLLLLLNILFVIAVTLFDYGLVAWTQNKSAILKNEMKLKSKTESEDNLEFDTVHQQNVLSLLGGLIVMMVLISILINVSFNRFVLCASNKIHNNMLSQLIKTTLRFFEVNPSGRILNRFSEDTKIIDDMLPQVLSEAIQSTFFVVALLLSAVLVNWWIVIPSVISIFFYFMICRMYLTTISKMTRLVATAKSPVLSSVASSLNGLTTIRTCKAEDFVCKEFDSRLDRHTAAHFLASALIPANCLWIELCNLGLLTFIVYVCIIVKDKTTSDGYIGLTLMQVMNMTMITSHMFIRMIQAFSFMPNVERMLQFADLEPEKSVINGKHLELLNLWPTEGQIKFENLYLRYSDDSDPVLWDLCFIVAAGSKVGIVGRTGAGKSSLISALFRLAKIEGSLLIDGVNVSQVDLLKLRSKISIIPQEPFLFKGTLRKNLDPLDEFEDALVWSALEDVELKKLFDTLDSPIDYEGSNLSLGQRQLLCLARAILRQNKILILDEATANVDLATDALIQKTIRTNFKECTVLTIAHRLDTIMDSDNILVMDNGRVVEYDHPFLLLQNDDSHFARMVRQADDATVKRLKIIAQEAYETSGIGKVKSCISTLPSATI